MRQLSSVCPAVAVICAGLLTAAGADPGDILPRPARNHGPQVANYVVVVPSGPVPVQPPTGHHYGPHPWYQVELSAPIYPWGWFGARVHPYRVDQRGYYGDWRQHSLGRNF